MDYSVDDIDAVMFDLDGTVYYGSKIIPGANDTIRFFRDNDISVFFTTNNSTKTRNQIFQRLQGMGIDCRLEEVLTSGYLAAAYAKRVNLENIYIFGSPNLKDEFESIGIQVVDEDNAENLLIGYDPEMTYSGLTAALQVALKAKCIIACNRERVFPGENAKPMPGCGAMTAPIEWCANRECDVVIGKPSPTMVEHIAKERNVDQSRILVVGDTFESDIEMAMAACSKAILIAGADDRHDVDKVATIAGIPSLFI